MKNQTELSFVEKVLPSSTGLLKTAGGIGLLTAASVGTYVWAKL